MKKISIIFMFCAHASFAQKNHFTNNGNQWVELVEDNVDVPYIHQVSTYAMGSDTFINGYQYKRFYNYPFKYVFVREDTVSNKVYAIQNAIGDSVEHLLYDFNLKLHDTFSVWLLSPSGNNDTVLNVVNRLDSFLYNGSYYKIWTLHNITGKPQFGRFIDYTVVEGIGCIGGLLFPLAPAFFEAGFELLCFSNEGNTISVPNGAGGFYLSPATCALAVNKITAAEDVTVTPNPANETSMIRFPMTIFTGNITLINTMGQVIFSKEIKQAGEIPIGKLLLPGLYIYRIQDKEHNQIFTGKFIYQ